MTSLRLEMPVGRSSWWFRVVRSSGTLAMVGAIGCGSVDESGGLIGSKSTTKVAINEVVSENGDLRDWIELYNLGARPVNLAGFFLGDDPDDPVEARLGDEVEIAGHGVVVIEADGDAESGPKVVPFGLKYGDTVVLSDAQGLLVDTMEFGPMVQGDSWARHPDGTGTPSACAAPTRDALNGSQCGG